MKLSWEYEFVAALARHWPELSPGSVARVAAQFMSASRSHKRLMEAECSYQEPREGYYERRRASLLKRLAKLVAGSPFLFKEQGDPRGCTVKLIYTDPTDNIEREMGVPQ
mgnify:CR=1 FL=1